MSQSWLYIVCGLAAVGLYIWVVLGMEEESWSLAAPVCALIASPGGLLALAATVEDRSIIGMIDLDRQSWAVMFGDTFALPVMAYLCARVWRMRPATGWGQSLEWKLGAFVLGLGLGVAFHWGLQVPGYTATGASASLAAPTLIWHDFVSCTVLVGGLGYASLPLLFRRGWTWREWVILACILIWMALVARDTVLGHLDPSWLHPAWDAETFQPK